MSDLHLVARGARRATMPLLCLALLAYLGYHAFVGERGIYTHWRLEEEERALAGELAHLVAERARIEQRIALIGPKALDPDMLDERARAVLNFAHPDEIIILRRTD